MANKHIDTLRKRTKDIQDARIARDAKAITIALQEFDKEVDLYIPVLMMQAKTYWDKGDYKMVEKLLRKNYDFVSEHETWKINFAHTFYCQDNKYRDAIRYYEPFVKK